MNKAEYTPIGEELASKDSSSQAKLSADGRKRRRLDSAGPESEKSLASHLVSSSCAVRLFGRAQGVSYEQPQSMQQIENEALNSDIPSARGATPLNHAIISWNGIASNTYAVPSANTFPRSLPPTDAALNSRPVMSYATRQAASAIDLVESNFNTEDANLLEFFRYGLAQWPDSSNIWPPINDFGNLGGSPLDGILPRQP